MNKANFDAKTNAKEGEFEPVPTQQDETFVRRSCCHLLAHGLSALTRIPYGCCIRRNFV